MELLVSVFLQRKRFVQAGSWFSLLPGASEATISEIERRIKGFQWFPKLIDQQSPRDILNRLLRRRKHFELEEMPVKFHGMYVNVSAQGWCRLGRMIYNTWLTKTMAQKLGVISRWEISFRRSRITRLNRLKLMLNAKRQTLNRYGLREWEEVLPISSHSLYFQPLVI